MPIPVAEIIQKAGIILNDEDNVRWTLEEIFGWINDAAGEIVVRRPPARSVIGILTLVEGALQSLPSNGVQVLDVVRNVPGKSVSRVMRRLLDDQQPDWYDMRKASTIRHFTMEEETPKRFYVYPPAKEGIQVEAKWSEMAPLISSIEQSLDLDRMYIGPIISYVLYRSYAKDSEYANGALAVTHFQAFSEALAADDAVTKAVVTQAGTQ